MKNNDLANLGRKLSNIRVVLIEAINAYVTSHYDENLGHQKRIKVTGSWFRDVLVNFEDGTQAKGSICTLTNQSSFCLDTGDGQVYDCDLKDLSLDELFEINYALVNP